MGTPGPDAASRSGTDASLRRVRARRRRPISCGATGRPVKLGRQPMDLLLLLVERHGQLVTRADIVGAVVGTRRLRGRRDGRQHRHQQGASGAPATHRTRRGSWRRCRARATGSSRPSKGSPADGPPAGAPDRPVATVSAGPIRRAPRRPSAIAVAAVAALLAVMAAARLRRLARWQPRAIGCRRHRGAALRQSRQRRRSRLPRRRAHRRNERLARTHRSRGTSR